MVNRAASRRLETFNIDSGRITIFKQTLVEMGYSEFFRFLFSPEEMMFGIELCGIDDGGAHRSPDKMTREHYDIKSKELVCFVYRSCRWQKRLTYRIAGKNPAYDENRNEEAYPVGFFLLLKEMFCQ